MSSLPSYVLRAPIVLLTGETGAGKSHLARQIFNQSTRWKERMVTVHFGAINESLIESELFGHERGAFTGATQAKCGLVEKCGDGTLFLDEIGELSSESQKKLLYLLEERRFSPVGSTVERQFSGRIIAATNRDLAKMVDQGKFRQDLYFRLQMAPLDIQPLRYHQAQLVALFKKLSNECAKSYLRPELSIDEAFAQWVQSYRWPGNIREMKNLIEYFYLRDENRFDLKHLPEWTKAKAAEGVTQEFAPLDYNCGLEQFEGRFFRQALVHFKGRVNETARQVGVSKSTLIAKIRKYGINTLEIRSQQFVQGYA